MKNTLNYRCFSSTRIRVSCKCMFNFNFSHNIIKHISWFKPFFKTGYSYCNMSLRAITLHNGAITSFHIISIQKKMKLRTYLDSKSKLLGINTIYIYMILSIIWPWWSLFQENVTIISHKVANLLRINMTYLNGKYLEI